ncbi:helix-turn-helix domain-containing protein [Micromonospora sp. RP3T]|uniref:winged helix-turn-helix transcriptional regulator n=1 Tax=Micromonospora sp. RP3T TaxID=2135446 RepID=UPI0018EDDCC7|nr:helix-turn-helix domain-containing protein [Micromonospora sp. RP3T]
MLSGCPAAAAEPDPSCPIEITLAVLKGRWTPLVFGEFLSGERTYSELSRALPALSDKVLSERLAQLTSAGVLERRRTPGWPVRVTYELTERGRALVPVLAAMRHWGAEAIPS